MMLRQYFTFLLIIHCLYVPSVATGQAVIKGKLKDNILLNAQSKDYLYNKIYLFGRNTEQDWAVLDSSKIDSAGNFCLHHPALYPKALCQLAFTSKGLKLGVYRNIILKKSTDTLSLSFSYKEVRSDVYFAYDPENKVLAKALTLVQSYQTLQENLQKQFSAEQLNYLDNHYLQKYQAMEALRVLKLDSLQKVIEQYRRQHKGTYAADVLLSLFAEPLMAKQYPTHYETRASFLKEHFVSLWNWEDASLLSSPFLEPRLYEYLSKYTYIHSFEGIQYSVDKLLEASKANPKVLEFVWNYLVKTYLKSGFEDMVLYLYDSYSESCHAQMTSTKEELQKIETLKKLRVGNPAPTIPMEQQEMESFSSILEQHEITVLYFWASTCEHCRNTSPELLKILAKHPKNIGVISISLDQDEQSWENYLNTLNATDWHHFCDLKGWQSQIVKNYAIRRTPTCYILDSQGTILKRELHPLQIEGALSEYFIHKN